MSSSSGAWNPGSWRDFAAAQQPLWPNESALKAAAQELAALPPLVFAGEARSLTAALGKVAAGKAFLLQAGDCAESFSESDADHLRDKLKVILQMAVALTYASGVPVVKVGRIAGQFAKPRSSDTETIDGITLPSFRGHMVNDETFSVAARTPNPQRLLESYHRAAATLNLLRAFTTGGFADLRQVHAWNLEFVASSSAGQRYDQVAAEIDRAMSFMAACGIDLDAEPSLHQVNFYTSHEALILPYEEALTRRDSLTGDYYDCSAHQLWIGDRTRQVNGAHIEFLSGIKNPIGIKVGPTAVIEDIVTILGKLDPSMAPGRISLITRYGAEKVRAMLPDLIDAVDGSGHPVVWVCDPCHGNTFTSSSGHKTRRFRDVMAEIVGFFEVHRSKGTWPGGVHIELTGDDVTECLGGVEEVLESDLPQRYTTTCDPRLNARQSLDLAFEISALLRGEA